jgi:hypothetical protein
MLMDLALGLVRMLLVDKLILQQVVSVPLLPQPSLLALKLLANKL